MKACLIWMTEHLLIRKRSNLQENVSRVQNKQGLSGMMMKIHFQVMGIPILSQLKSPQVPTQA